MIQRAASRSGPSAKTAVAIRRSISASRSPATSRISTPAWAGPPPASMWTMPSRPPSRSPIEVKGSVGWVVVMACLLWDEDGETARRQDGQDPLAGGQGADHPRRLVARDIAVVLVGAGRSIDDGLFRGARG